MDSDAGVQSAKATEDYDDFLIVFFDVLGFKALVKGSDGPESILRSLRLMTDVAAVDDELARLWEKETLNFSDSVIRLTRVLSETNRQHRIGIVVHEIVDLVHIQMNLVANGIFVRGAIVAGLAHHEPPHTFGPGIIEAYNLESQNAKYPRIVISPDLIERVANDSLLRGEMYSSSEELTNIDQLTTRYGDAQLFIDYLRVASHECDDVYEYIEFLTRHRTLIVENLQRHVEKPAVHEKYEWLAGYHNAVVLEFPPDAFDEFGCHRDDFLVPVSSPSVWRKWMARFKAWLTSAGTPLMRNTFA